MGPIRRRSSGGGDVRNQASAGTFKLWPHSVLNRRPDRFEFIISGSFETDKPLDSVALSRSGTPVGRLQYWAAPRTLAKAVMHNLGALQFTFSFGIWSPWGGNLAEETFTIEAKDSFGIVNQAAIRCTIDDALPSQFCVECDKGVVLTEMPVDPPMVVQLDEATIRGDQLRVRGWTVARNAIETVRVFAGHSVITAVHGQATDRPLQLEQHRKARQVSFTAELQLDGTEPPNQVVVIANSVAGEQYQGMFPFTPGDSVVALTNTAKLTGYDSAYPSQLPAVIHVEYPEITGGSAVLKERKPFRLAGWAVARDGIERLNVYLDSRFVGAVSFGTMRRDVAAAFPNWPKAANSGFSMLLPARLLIRSPCTVLIEAMLDSQRKIAGEFQLLFGEAASVLATDDIPEPFMSDLEAWRFARTILIFARDRADEIFSAMETESETMNAKAGASLAQNARKAFYTLQDAWAGKPINNKLAQYLRGHGYL